MPHEPVQEFGCGVSQTDLVVLDRGEGYGLMLADGPVVVHAEDRDVVGNVDAEFEAGRQ